MQTPSDSGPQSPILPLISVCLLAVLAWNLFLVWSSVSRLLSIHKSTNRLQLIGFDREKARVASSLRENQFFPSIVDEIERNYASSVLALRPTTIDFNPGESQLRRGIFPIDSTSNYKHSRNNRDGPAFTEMIEANVENGNANDRVDLTFVEGASNGEETSLNKGTISRIESSSNFMQRPSKEVSSTMGPADGRCAEFDRQGWCSSDVDSSHKFESGREEENSGGRTADFPTKIEKRADATASRFLARKLLALLLEESSVFRINSREVLRGIEKEGDREGTAVDDKFAEFLTRGTTDRDNEIRPLEEDDYPEEQFGVVPEVGANCMEEKSVIHSGKNATQSRSGLVEPEDGVGPPPETSCLKNGHSAESTISFGRAAASGRGKEEEDLNDIIRRMIIAELKRHRDKETVLRRALSESVLSKKKRDDENRAGPFDVRGRTLFRDLLELEENLRAGANNPSDNESAVAETTEKDFAKQVEDRSTNGAEVNATTVDRADDSIGSMAAAFKGDSNIRLERKVNAACLRDSGTERAIRVGEASQSESSKSTQTERVYVIRAVRSCPLRKNRLPLYFQMQRVASGRDAVRSKTVFASLDLSKFIFRKASDNLIYEKGKGSRSPSYVPVPERHRWKYVTPNRIQ